MVALSIAFGAMGQKYEGVIDKTVAVVGNSVILLSQVESEAQMMQFNGYISDRNLRCEVLENMMISKLFYTQAMLDSLTVNPDNVNAALQDRMANILSKRSCNRNKYLLEIPQISQRISTYLRFYPKCPSMPLQPSQKER